MSYAQFYYKVSANYLLFTRVAFSNISDLCYILVESNKLLPLKYANILI